MSSQLLPDLIDVKWRKDRAIAVLKSARFDDSNAEALSVQLTELAEEAGPRGLDLDLGSVTRLTSLALGKLLVLNKKVRAAGGQLRLLNVGPSVYEALAVTKLDKLLNVQVKGAA